MALDMAQFARPSGARQGRATNEELPKAMVWLNLGYTVEVDVEATADKPATVETRFISLPVGIPVDTIEKLATNRGNDEFRALQSARNELLDNILDVAKSLKSGEEKLLNLEIQLRRINDEPAAISTNQNPFVKKLDLVAAD